MSTRKPETYTVERRHPVARIWIAGKLDSVQKKRSSDSYKERIREAARDQMLGRAPFTSTNLIVEVWYCYPDDERCDVDNVLKPILDALEGIVYANDRQIRQVKCTAFPDINLWEVRTKGKALGRLRNTDRRQFLVLVFDDVNLGALDC